MTVLQRFWRNLIWQKEGVDKAQPPAPAAQTAVPEATTLNIDIAPHDPLLTYVQHTSGAIDVQSLNLESTALQKLKEAGVKLIVPLVSQGELIGLINLGTRLSEQEYSTDDMRLLSSLATQAAPALRVAQLVRQQERQAAERERIAQELRVARLIQQTLLPQEVPQVAGWSVNAYYQPAREVGGDFYDFIHFPDGKIGFIVADVTDKGVPAALVMATTRSILHSAAERLGSPGAVLQRTNDVLHPQIPPKMFVTCFYAVLDPATGHIQYANAGHDVPYHYTTSGIKELRATGMPLGLLPGMNYEEKETTLGSGEYVLMYSDGLVEAHASDGEMFGFPRLQDLMTNHHDGASLNDYLLTCLADFTGAEWEQEDDVTMVTLQCTQSPEGDENQMWQTLAKFEIESKPDNERAAMERVAQVVADLPLTKQQLDRLKTAVAEATMNAMEHGNNYDPHKPVHIEVATKEKILCICITDQGVTNAVKEDALKEAELPNLEAKLAGQQSPRGWGLFLIQNMVDEMQVHEDDQYHTVKLKVHMVDEDGDGK